MVKIVGFNLRENTEGRQFFALILQGGIEIVKSSTGSSYVTIRKCSLPTTFDEETCKALIGQELPGSVQKVECEPYEYAIQQTGEVVVLTYRYEYVEEQTKNVVQFTKVGNQIGNAISEFV
ncbi:MAG TPA: hypothetical protein VF622_20440 [Segetibacter sp.]